MTYKNIKTIFAILIATTTLVNAQKMSLEECIKRGLENSKSLSISNTNIARNEGLNNEISAAKLPQVKLFASYSRLSDVPNSEIKLPIMPNPVVLQEPILNSYNLRLNVTQPVFTGNRISSQEKGIENQTKVLKADYEILKNEETIKIIAAYYSLSAAMEQLKLVNENIAMMQKRLTDINDFLQNGLATRNDVLKVEVQISNLISKKIDSEIAINSAKAQLNTVMGRDINTPLEIDEFIFRPLESAGEFEWMRDMAKTKRGEFNSLALKQEVLEENLNVARSGYLPDLFLSSNLYYSNPTQRIFPQKDEFRATWDVSLNLQWNVLDWGSTAARVEQVNQSIKGLQTSKKQVEDAIDNEVYQNYILLNGAKEKLLNLEKTLEQAEENYRVTLENYKAQNATAADLLDADTLLFAAKINLQLAKINLVVSDYKLKKSTGRPLF